MSVSHGVVGFLLAMLVCWRITRLITFDSITEPFREVVEGWSVRRRSNKRRGWKLDELVVCPYCMSVWVTGVAAAVWYEVDRMTRWMAVLLWWALAGSMALLAAAAEHKDS